MWFSRTKPTVLVGMSGGVDSSVTAALLLERGYHVVGGFIKNWSDTKDLQTGECAWRGERRDAIRVAAQIGIPLLTFDFEEQYRAKIVEEIFRGYAAGETPNPDVLCNEYIKFGLFADEARRLGMDFVATGHYARVARSSELVTRFVRYIFPSYELRATNPAQLLRGKDPEKDQSYFLHRVSQEVLRRTLFPIGEYKKNEVRAIAERLQLPVADKPDSQGICFIGKLDMTEFLRKKNAPTPGEIVDEHGVVIGQHEGLDGFTIGQRHGFHISKGSEPWYVAKKDIVTNRLVVVQGSEHPLLYCTEARIRDAHWISGVVPTMPLSCDVQVRYRQTPVRARLVSTDGFILHFEQPVKAVAAGQSAVLYHGDECVGGGVLFLER